MKATLSEQQLDDLVSYLNESKWFESQGAKAMRDDWRDRTLARTSWLAGINKLKDAGTVDDRLPPDLQKKARFAEMERRIEEAAKKKRK